MLGRTADGLIARFGWRRGLRLFLQLRVAKILPRGRLVRVSVPILAAPAYVRARTTDSLVLKELVLKGNFEFEVPGDPHFVVDAGANIGLISAYFATRFPQARIVALEIDAENFAVMRRNLQPYPTVTPMLAGLWSHATRLVVANPESAAFGFRAQEADVQQGLTSSVPGYSVADIMRQFAITQVDVLKIDIEGGEREVFGDEAEEWIDRVKVIAIELHDWLVPGCEQAVATRVRDRFVRIPSGEFDVFVRADLPLTRAVHVPA